MAESILSIDLMATSFFYSEKKSCGFSFFVEKKRLLFIEFGKLI